MHTYFQYAFITQPSLRILRLHGSSSQSCLTQPKLGYVSGNWRQLTNSLPSDYLGCVSTQRPVAAIDSGKKASLSFDTLW